VEAKWAFVKRIPEASPFGGRKVPLPAVSGLENAGGVPLRGKESLAAHLGASGPTGFYYQGSCNIGLFQDFSFVGRRSKNDESLFQNKPSFERSTILLNSNAIAKIDLRVYSSVAGVNVQCWPIRIYKQYRENPDSLTPGFVIVKKTHEQTKN
jgi:hypothetical protein